MMMFRNEERLKQQLKEIIAAGKLQQELEEANKDMVAKRGNAGLQQVVVIQNFIFLFGC